VVVILDEDAVDHELHPLTLQATEGFAHDHPIVCNCLGNPFVVEEAP
jgi:hypothetical protein